MRSKKMGVVVLLVAALGVGSTGCGTFEIFTLASAAGKLANNQVGALTAAEWQLLSTTGANLAATPELALSGSEAEAIVDFLAANGYASFNDIASNPPSQESLSALAQAFAGRATEAGLDLTNPDDVEEFFEQYLRDLGEGLRNMLAGIGVQIPV